MVVVGPTSGGELPGWALGLIGVVCYLLVLFVVHDRYVKYQEDKTFWF
jgi:hypothetical protein